MKIPIFLLATALLPTACSDSDNPTGSSDKIPVLTFEQRVYSPTDTVWISLINPDSETAWFEQCGLLDVEVLVGNAWVRDHEHARACRSPLPQVAPVLAGDTITTFHYRWSPGTYRFRANWLKRDRDLSSAYMLYSDRFVVE